MNTRHNIQPDIAAKLYSMIDVVKALCSGDCPRLFNTIVIKVIATEANHSHRRGKRKIRWQCGESHGVADAWCVVP